MGGNKMKKGLFLICILFVFLTSLGSSSSKTTSLGQKNNTFITNMTEIIPQPRSKEFSDYHNLINTFFQSINNNDFNLSLKVFPIMEDYNSINIENYFNRLGDYRIISSAPIPKFDTHNFLETFNRYSSMWEKVYWNLYVASYPEIEDIEITMETKEWKKEIEKLNSIKITKKYSIPKVTLEKSMKLNVLDQAMKAVDKKLIEVKTKIDDEEIIFDLIIIKIKNNWRVLSISYT